MVGFATYIADKDFALGEDYNIVDDSIISYDEFIRYLALLVGRRMGTIPIIRQTWLRPGMILAARTWLYLEQRFGVRRIRVFEIGSATYMASSYWISNKKTKEAGYKYRYPDVKEGMRDTVDWFRRVGWLDQDYNPQAIWTENMGLKNKKPA
jgi:nucleoside-diphosphate-sugar epimerase